MRIRAFEGASVRECLHQVRQALGPDAVILDSRRTRTAGILGFGQRDAVRIVAATGVTLNETPVESSLVPSNRPDTAGDQLTRMADEIEALKRSITEVRRGAQCADAADAAATVRQHLYNRMMDMDIAEKLAENLLEGLPDESQLPGRMAERLKIGGPLALRSDGVKTAALIGPTGVGKSTTIAKLAAQFALLQKKRVAFITLDTQRIAAVEQLRTYSEIMRIPLCVAHDRGEVAAAIAAYADMDLILIDTAGRSQRNAMQLAELKSMIESLDCETHLVLSASTRERDLLDQAERFGEMGVDRLLFTKLDEATTLGTLYTLAASSGIPLSYLTTGQQVPDDIEVAQAERIVASLLTV